MIRKLVLATLSFAIVCALAEATLRATHLFNARVAWTQPDALVGWRFTPGREYWFHGENDHPVTGRINAMGWRDRERERAKPHGVRRVAVLGDSFVEAFQVELDSTFTAIAERVLNADGAGPRCEVMNFGRSGMSPAEELLVLEGSVLACDPDAVVLVFTPQNDVADVDPATAADRNRPFFRLAAEDSLLLDAGFAARRGFRVRERINPIKQRSALVSLVTERYNVWRQTRTATAPAGARALTGEQTLCTSSANAMFSRNYTLCKALIARMAGVCSARGVDFLLMCVPIASEPDALAAARALDPSFDPEFFDRDLGALADSLGARFVPLTAAFRAQSAASGERLFWVHWNYAGHRTVARALVEALR